VLPGALEVYELNLAVLHVHEAEKKGVWGFTLIFFGGNCNLLHSGAIKIYIITSN